MRIISGSGKGRKLVPIQGCRIRPTSDRTKEAVFNILGPTVRKANVLDLFAGTGALGIEALSRGADHATFIDVSCDVIQKNLNLCRFNEKASVLCHDIIRDPIPESLHGRVFDLVFIDPPYGQGYIEQTLEKESFIHLLNGKSIIIAEQSVKESLQIKLPALDIFRQKKYSKTIISFIHKI